MAETKQKCQLLLIIDMQNTLELLYKCTFINTLQKTENERNANFIVSFVQLNYSFQNICTPCSEDSLWDHVISDTTQLLL